MPITPPNGFDWDKGVIRDLATGAQLTTTVGGGGSTDVSDRVARLLGVVSATSLPLPAGAATEVTQSKRYAGGKSSVGGTLNTAGDNVVLTPPVGQAITAYWVSFLPSSDDTAGNLVTAKFSNGTTLYVGYAVAHWEPFVAPTNATLILNLQNTQLVAWTIHYSVA